MKTMTSIASPSAIDGQYVVCPACGQKLFEALSCEGRTTEVVKCRRCKRFVVVEITS